MKLVCDTEVYANYVLIGFKDIVTGDIYVWEFARGERANLRQMRRFMKQHLIIGFNLKNFDFPIIAAALAGFSTDKIKKVANAIIVDEMKPWEVEEKFGLSRIEEELNFIDLFDVAPGKASLKIYNGRVHGRRMQDLPIDPDAELTPEDMDTVYDYWVNDLESTENLYRALKTQLDLREALSKENGIDLRSKSDAQVAEAIIKNRVKQIIGRTPKKPVLEKGTRVRYRAPEFIQFESAEMRAMLKRIENHEFRVDGRNGQIIAPEWMGKGDGDETDGALVNVGGTDFRMGIGGLHSCESRQAVVCGEGNILRDIDVASYYPNIILNLGLYPEQLGKAFLKVYRSIVKTRLAAKKKAGELKKEIKELEEKIKSVVRNDRGGPSLMEETLADLKKEFHEYNVANEGGKIMINGSFGKLGSPYSVLYSPNLLLTVTMTGQLSLLMLIEWLWKEGIKVVSGNTDGIVVHCPKSKEKRLNAIVAEWQRVTGFETEATDYRAIYSANVNNYIAVKQGGGTKLKGLFAKSGLEEKKNPTNEICSEAVAEFLEKGTPISKYIMEAEDIKKFVTVRTVNGGAIYGVKPVYYERISEKTGKVLKPGLKFDAKKAEYLGKAIRWYYSTESEGAIHYKASLNRVPKSDGAKPMMLLSEECPDDLDRGWYIREARTILYNIGYSDDLIGSTKKKNARTAH